MREALAREEAKAAPKKVKPASAEAKPQATKAEPAAAAGWYRDPRMAGTQRYWDGSAWTDNVAPLPPPAPKQRGVLGSARIVALGILMAIAVLVVFVKVTQPSRDLDCATQRAEVAAGQRVAVDPSCR